MRSAPEDLRTVEVRDLPLTKPISSELRIEDAERFMGSGV